MPGEAVGRIDTNMEASLDRALTRYEEKLQSLYDRLIGSQPVSSEERGKEYLTIAGDLPAIKAWLNSQAAIHGMPIARTMLDEMAKNGEKFIDNLVDNAKEVTGGPVQ